MYRVIRLAGDTARGNVLSALRRTQPLYRIFRLAADTARPGEEGGAAVSTLLTQKKRKRSAKKEPISFTFFSCFDASFDRRGHII